MPVLLAAASSKYIQQIDGHSDIQWSNYSWPTLVQWKLKINSIKSRNKKLINNNSVTFLKSNTLSLRKYISFSVFRSKTPTVWGIWHNDPCGPSKLDPPLKFPNFTIQGGRWLLFLNNQKNYVVSTTVWLILTKFRTVMHLWPPRLNDCWNFWNLQSKMADGRHLEKAKNIHIPATTWPVLTKFSIMMQLDQPIKFS